MASAILLKDVYFNYEEKFNDSGIYILQDINLEILSGELVVILGKNGSGKSTLLKVIDLLYPIAKGMIRIFGNSVNRNNVYELRRKIGLVFQNPDRQIVTGSVEEEIIFGLENIGIESDEIKKRIEETLFLTGIEDLIDKGTEQLSGGQKQLVAIASVVAMKPDIILFDEPYSMINNEYQEKVRKIIRNLKEAGKTIIIVTHRVEECLNADRCIILNEGRIVFNDKAELIYKDINLLKNLGIEPPFPAEMSKIIQKTIDIGFPVSITVNDLFVNIKKRILNKS